MKGRDARTGSPLNPPTYFLLSLLGVLIIAKAGPHASSEALFIRVPGALLILVGLGLNVAASRRFERQGIDIRPGRRSDALAIHGPFARSRNPMYLGMVLILAGASIGLGSPWGLLVAGVFALVVNRYFIRFEEALLRETFGDAYTRYAARVRRWI